MQIWKANNNHIEEASKIFTFIVSFMGKNLILVLHLISCLNAF